MAKPPVKDEPLYATLREKLRGGDAGRVFAGARVKLDPGAEVGTGVQLEGPNEIGARSSVQLSRLGAYTAIGADSHVSKSVIGRFCSVGAKVSINLFNHPTAWLSTSPLQYSRTAFAFDAATTGIPRRRWRQDTGDVRVVVGNDVWIGSNTIVMPRVRIGHGAIVGAGSVVTRDVPDYAIVGGNPARVLRMRFDAAIVERLLALAWWDMGLDALEGGVPFDDIERALDMLEERKRRAEERVTEPPSDPTG